MTDLLERDLAKMFDDSRVESDDFQVVRMAARAVDAVPAGGVGIPGRFVAAVAAMAVVGFLVVLANPVMKAPPGDYTGEEWDGLDDAVATYLDVGGDEGSLWASPLEGAGSDLSEEALLEEYAALLNDMEF